MSRCSAHLEPPVVLVDCLCEVHPLPLPHQGPQSRVVVQSDVVPNKVPIQAVATPLLLANKQVGGCKGKIEQIT